jgi:two-component system, chemotaxis family, sensor kinase Cph1
MKSKTMTRTEIDLTCFEKEPIHLRGQIQSHGVLFVLQEPELKILQVSNNTFHLFGLHPSSLINQKLSNFLYKKHLNLFQESLKSPNLKSANPIKIELGDIYKPLVFDAMFHRKDGVLILEIEPEIPVTESFKFVSFYHTIRNSATCLQSASDFHHLCQIIVREIRKITGFDRVMLYKFDQDGHGAVIAEESQEGLESFLGLHYPMTDIPPQARLLYCHNWLRLIPDVNDEPIEIIPAKNPLTDRVIDLSFSVLRSVSPCHIEYLKNMGVTASMSISVLKNQKLWGLIACHHYSPKYVPYEIREACEFLGQVMSFELLTKEENEDYEYRLKTKVNQAKFLENLVFLSAEALSKLVNNQPNLLDIVSAHGAAVIGSEEPYHIIGKTPDLSEIKEIVSWLDKHNKNIIFSTDSLSKHYPAAQTFKDVASGLLAVSISESSIKYILWFRPEVVQTVHWAGNPEEAFEVVEIENETGYRLSPRRSFEQWKETVCCQSLPWKEYELEGAVQLRNSLVNIVLRQGDELAKLNKALQQSESREREKAILLEQALQELQKMQTQLVNSEKMSSLGQLIAGIAHEINNPINFIYGNLTHAEEYTTNILNLVNLYQESYTEKHPEIEEEIDAMDLEFVREDLPKVLGSIKLGAERIITLVQSLRTFSRIDEADLKEVDIHEGIDSTLLILSNRFKPKPDRASIEIIKSYGNLPLVECYVGQLNQVFMNILSNAIDAIEESQEKEPTQKEKGILRIITELTPDRKTVIIRIADNGIGMTEEVRKLIFGHFYTTKPAGKGTGIGLTISYDIIVDKHHGCLDVNSSQGEGTEFIIKIPLRQTQLK